MPDEPSLASANSDFTRDVSLGSGARLKSSTNDTRDSDTDADLGSVKPKRTVKHLGYGKLCPDKFFRCTFAPGFKFEYRFTRLYPWQHKPGWFDEFDNCEFFQLRNDVENIRKWNMVNNPTNPIIATCDRFLEMYNKPEDMPSKEVYLASLQ